MEGSTGAAGTACAGCSMLATFAGCDATLAPNVAAGAALVVEGVVVVAGVASVARAFRAPHCGQVWACEYHPPASLTHLLPLHGMVARACWWCRWLAECALARCEFVAQMATARFRPRQPGARQTGHPTVLSQNGYGCVNVYIYIYIYI